VGLEILIRNDMLSADQISKLTQQILSSLPEGGEEIKKHLHTALLGGLRRLDLVTREEFEIQSRLLQRSREKLELMEKRLADLEQRRVK